MNKGDYVRNHVVSFYFFKEKKMSYMKRYFEEKLEEIMNTFSGNELVDKLRSTFGFSDSQINDVLIEYGRR